MVSLKPELLVMSVETTGEPVYHISLSVEDQPNTPGLSGTGANETDRIRSPMFPNECSRFKKLPIKLIEVSSEKKSVDSA